MDIILHPSTLRGDVTAPPSKSMAHRILICAALSDNPTQIVLPETSRDTAATIACLRSIGAEICENDSGYTVFPIGNVPETAVLPCGESGTTLRLLLPIIGIFGIDATFLTEGRLARRPLSPLWEEMERMGCRLSRPTENAIRCTGKLCPGKYMIDGSVSSQFVSGLLLATSLLRSPLEVTGKPCSSPYIDMTRQVMTRFAAPDFHSPSYISVEGDWSNAAFWLAAVSLGNPLTVRGLDENSLQGDRKIVEFLPLLQNHCTVSAAHIPDLIPVLAMVAAANQGAQFTEIGRLRLKESNRVEAIVSMLNSLGGHAEATADTLTVFGTGLTGGTVDSFSDHRIAMAAAIASTVCTAPVTVLHAESVEKSYPTFWDKFQQLGGKICKVPTEIT